MPPPVPARLAATEKRHSWPIEDMHLDLVRHGVEAQDRIGLPVHAGDARVVERNALVQLPAHRLHDGGFDLVGDAIRIDHLAGIDGGDRADQARAAGLAVDFDLGRDGAINGEVLVAREGKAVAAVLGRLSAGLPAEGLCRLADDVAAARILEMLDAEFDRIGARPQRQTGRAAYSSPSA